MICRENEGLIYVNFYNLLGVQTAIEEFLSAIPVSPCQTATSVTSL